MKSRNIVLMLLMVVGLTAWSSAIANDDDKNGDKDSNNAQSMDTPAAQSEQMADSDDNGADDADKKLSASKDMTSGSTQQGTWSSERGWSYQSGERFQPRYYRHRDRGYIYGYRGADETCSARGGCGTYSGCGYVATSDRCGATISTCGDPCGTVSRCATVEAAPCEEKKSWSLFSKHHKDNACCVVEHTVCCD